MRTKRIELSPLTELPPWVLCPGGCGEFWCTLHRQHAHECHCPEIELWGDLDPYSRVNKKKLAKVLALYARRDRN